jgi:hypothetical protein
VQSPCGLDRSAPVLHLPDHLEIGLGLEDHPKAGADKPLVVRQEDANAHAG